MTENHITIRAARIDDLDFIVEVIIEAEKSGTDKLGLANLFGLSEQETGGYLREILEEEIDGCEFSLESFCVAEVEGVPAAAVAGWIEGQNSSELPSSMLKANLLGYVLPRQNIEKSRDFSGAAEGIQLDRTPGTLQIEYVYCKPEFRKRGLVKSLLMHHLEKSNVGKAEVQVFADNLKAIDLYRKVGFEIEKEVVSEDKMTGKIFPSDKKILMTKHL